MSSLQPQVQEVCRLVAQGYTNREIAEISGFTVQYISQIRNNPMAIPFIQELMEKRNSEMMKSEERTKRLDGLRDGAYEVIEDTMNDARATRHLRLSAANSAIKAHKEHIETQHSQEAPVFDSERIAQLLKEKNLIYLNSEEEAEAEQKQLAKEGT